VQPNNHNAYTLGSIGKHNVVIACLLSEKYGIASATTVAMQLLFSFHSICFNLMIEIKKEIPNNDADIRLGDIVISNLTNTREAVMQYDYDKALSDGDFQRTGMLSRSSQILLTALSKLKANHLTREKRFFDFLIGIEQTLS
jgi:hypothetical protein